MTSMAAGDHNPPSAPRSLHEDYNYSSSTSFSSDSDTSMDWETTPPNSPEDTIHKTPHIEGSSSISKSTGKMSLDFIAPGGRSGSISSTYIRSLPSPVPSSPGSPSSPNRPSLERNVHSQRATLQIILPSLEKFPPVDLTTARSASWPMLSTIPPFVVPAPLSAPPPTSPRQTPPRPPRLDVDGLSNEVTPRRVPKRTDQREDRHPYDAEEKYAIIYLRVVKHLRWDEVVARFHALFPAGQPRRCAVASSPFYAAAAAPVGAAPADPADGKRSTGAAAAAAAAHSPLPPVYTRRNVQGLQCRWYRIRDEEGLAKLRGTWGVTGGAVGRREKRVLEEMEHAGVVSDTFLALLKGREGRTP